MKFLSIDPGVTQFFLVHRTLFFDEFFYTITQFGSLYLVLFIILLVLAALYIHNRRSFILPFLITISGAELSTSLIKLAVHRVRPGADIAFYLEKSFSFPSGHATIAAALYGFIIYLLFRIHGSNFRTKISACSFFILILLIGFSRIYLGVHYLSDVLGGFLVGGLWLLAGISILKIRNRKGSE